MNKKIASYTIIRSDSIVFLSHEVNKMIRQDWRPIGGVCLDPSNQRGAYFQSMVLYSE